MHTYICNLNWKGIKPVRKVNWRRKYMTSYVEPTKRVSSKVKLLSDHQTTPLDIMTHLPRVTRATYSRDSHKHPPPPKFAQLPTSGRDQRWAKGVITLQISKACILAGKIKNGVIIHKIYPNLYYNTDLKIWMKKDTQSHIPGLKPPHNYLLLTPLPGGNANSIEVA